MVFTSTAFLFAFLPTFLGVYALLPPARRTLAILVASYAFYAWWRPDFALAFALTTVTAILAGRTVSAGRGRPSGRRALVLGVAALLGSLGYFKYAGFGIESLNALLQAVGLRPLPMLDVVLPIGISFYVLQAISYLVDVHRGDAPADARPVDVAAFIALFPQLIAGPIVRFKTVAADLAAPRVDPQAFAAGAERFMLGFVKKVLIADAVAPLVDGAFSLTSPSAVEAWLGVVAYAIQLLYDFSGYSDMAIGIGLMLGFRFPENFVHPYRALSVTEFWRRWHVSLGSWLRDYLYVPLGGNRAGRRRTYANLATVMLLAGLWHGANWTYVLWGAWHAAWLMAERLAGVRANRPAKPRLLAHAATLVVILAGWALFRADDPGAARAMLAGMVGAHGLDLGPDLAWLLGTRTLLTGAVGVVWALTPPSEPQQRRTALARWALAPLFVIGVARAVADAASPFLYFQF